MSFSPDRILDGYLLLNGFRTRRVRVRSCEVRYFEKRAKKERGLIVFVHGIGASAAHFCQVMVSLQKAGYSVLALDLPAHGLSSDPDERLSAQVLFELFREWMNQVVPGKSVLIGNSLGGAISLRFALENSDRLHRLIAISPAGGFPNEADWEQFKRTLTFDSIEDAKRFIPKIYHRPPFYLPILYRPFLSAMTRRGLRELLEGTDFKDFQVEPRLFSSMPSTLLIWGKSEKLFPPSHLARLKELLPPSVTIEEPEGIGHCPQLDSPRWLHRRICEFVDQEKSRHWVQRFESSSV